MSEQPPERIFLQWHGDSEPEERTGMPDGVTFSRTRVHDADIEYVRRDVADELLEACKEFISAERAEHEGRHERAQRLRSQATKKGQKAITKAEGD